MTSKYVFFSGTYPTLFVAFSIFTLALADRRCRFVFFFAAASFMHFYWEQPQGVWSNGTRECMQCTSPHVCDSQSKRKYSNYLPHPSSFYYTAVAVADTRFSSQEFVVVDSAPHGDCLVEAISYSFWCDFTALAAMWINPTKSYQTTPKRSTRPPTRTHILLGKMFSKKNDPISNDVLSLSNSVNNQFQTHFFRQLSTLCLLLAPPPTHSPKSRHSSRSE